MTSFNFLVGAQPTMDQDMLVIQWNTRIEEMIFLKSKQS